MTDKQRRKRERKRRREERRKKGQGRPPPEAPDWGRWITPGVVIFFVLLIGTVLGVLWRTRGVHAHGEHERGDDGHAPVTSGGAR